METTRNRTVRDPQIIDYLLVREGSRRDAEAEVQRLISEGWQPYGPPDFQLDITNKYGPECITQPMVKYADQENGGGQI